MSEIENLHADVEGNIIPDPPVKIFTDQLTGSNKNLPLERGLQRHGYQSQIGNISDLPVNVQNIIQQIQDVNTLAEKAAIAHSFTNSFITPEEQDRTNERINLSFADLANDPRGDCDDYVGFKMGLLLHANVNPRHIFSVSALAEITITSGDKFSSISDAHNFLIIQDEEGKYILLDNNLKNTPLIDPNTLIVDAELFISEAMKNKGGIADSVSAEVKFPLVSFVVDGRGTLMTNEDAFKALVKYLPSVQKRLNAVDEDTKQEPVPSSTDMFEKSLIPSFSNKSGYDDLVQKGTIPDNLEQNSPELYEALKNGGLSDYIYAEIVSFKQLEEAFEKNPQALDALRHSNFKEGIMQGFIIIEQVVILSEEQLNQLKSRVSGSELKGAIESFTDIKAEVIPVTIEVHTPEILNTQPPFNY